MKSNYLWFDVDIEGEPPPEMAILHHGLTSTADPTHTIVLTVRDSTTPERYSLSVASKHQPALAPRAPGTADSPIALTDATGLELAAHCYGLVHRQLMDEAHSRAYSRIHAALMEVRQRRLIILGHSGAGKTTLALRLAAAGAHLLSDEGVFIREGLTLGLPRRVHIKSSGWGLVQSLLAESPALATTIRLSYPEPVHCIDPAFLESHPARPALTSARADALVFLGAPEGPVRIESITTAEALDSMVGEAHSYSSSSESLTTSRARLIREIATLTRQTPYMRLNGHHREGAVETLLDWCAQ